MVTTWLLFILVQTTKAEVLCLAQQEQSGDKWRFVLFPIQAILLYSIRF